MSTDYIATISEQMGESDTLYAAIKSFKGLADIIDFSNGNPLGQPFIPASNAGALAFTSPEMRQYGFTSGLRSVRETVARYIESDVYRSSVLINADNVICGEGGVTALYSSFLKAIIKPDDVVLVTAPGYGLFSNQPKVEGADVYAVPLREEDHYHHNSEMIDNAITDINRTGKHVRAFLFANPLNPTGNVERDEQLRELAAVFRKHDIFIIEDMAYRGTVYDQQDPVHSIVSVAPDMLPQTLTLESLSKAYGLAAARAGFAVGTQDNIKKIADNMAVFVDTTALPQQKAIEATFHPSNNVERLGYLDKLATDYKYRFAILKAFIEGIDTVGNRYKEKIEREISNIYSNEFEELLDGIPGVKVVTTPEAGFFAPVDFSDWRCKFFGNMKIETTHSLVVELLAKNAGILTLPSQSMMWPTTHLIVRLSLVAEQMLPGREHSEHPDIRNLIEGLARIKAISKRLTSTPQHELSPPGNQSLLLQFLT